MIIKRLDPETLEVDYEKINRPKIIVHLQDETQEILSVETKTYAMQLGKNTLDEIQDEIERFFHNLERN